MANLPDLNTDDISTLAHWDLGVEDIPKSLFIPLMIDPVEYDNGIEGTMWLSVSGGRYNNDPTSPPDAIEVKVRYRTDGLLIAYALRENEGTGSERAVVEVGPHTPMSRRWLPVHNGHYSIHARTLLSAALDHMENAIPNSYDTDERFQRVDHAQVEHYDYQFPETTNIYLQRIYKSNSGGSVSGYMTQPRAGNRVIEVNVQQHQYADAQNTVLNGESLLVHGSKLNRAITIDEADVPSVLLEAGNQNHLRYTGRGMAILIVLTEETA